MSELLESLVIDSLSSSPGLIKTGEVANNTVSVAGIPLPLPIIENGTGTVNISFSPRPTADYGTSVGSSIAGTSINYSLGDYRLTNLVHDFTFNHLIAETDKKLYKIFKHSGSEITNYSPDFVKESVLYNIVVEVGTYRGNRRSAINYFHEKRQKYESILEVISESEKANNGNSKPILFGIIIVSRDAVITNLELSYEQMQEMQLRFLIGIRIEKTLSQMGLIAIVDKEATRTRKELSQFFLSLDKKTEILIEDWNKELNAKINNDPKEAVFLKAHLLRWDEERIARLIDNDITSEAAEKILKILKKTITETIGKSRSYEFDSEVRRAKSEEEHEKFEEEYVMMNEGNMRSDKKAFINLPFIVPMLQLPERRTSVGLKIVEPKFDTVYDVLYYTAIVKTLNDPLYFPDKEMDLLEQYGWESPSYTSYEEAQDSIDQETQTSGLSKFINADGLAETEIETYLHFVEIDDKKQKQLVEDYKRKTNRVQMSLTKEESFELALKGVEGKGLTTEYIKGKVNRNYDASLDAKRKNEPDWFHIRDTDTSDMDDLMLDKKFYEDILLSVPFDSPSLINWKLLINQARSAHGDSYVKHKEEEFVEWFSKTRIFSWGKLVSDIGTEVNISLKQNCKKNEFVFKKLQDFNVWLLIKPTKKEEQIFFSILFDLDEVCYKKSSSVFKSLYPLYGGSKYGYTHFISLTESKLLNWVITLPRLISLFRFWTNFAGVTPYKEELIMVESKENPDYKNLFGEAMPMLMLSMIIGLADKTEVEEEITRTRYLVMESLEEWPIEPKPYKLVSKVSKQMRSRLTVWLYRKHKQLCNLYSSNPPRAKNEELYGQGQTETSSQLFWHGFINPYTHSSLSSGQQVINLFYLGYIKNKDEVAQVNKLSKLYDKILVYEQLYNEEIAQKMGIESPEDPLPHCFDIELLLDSCEKLKKRIKVSYPDFEAEFEKQLGKFLFRTSVEEEFSTLKASSNFGPSLYDRKSVNERYSRSKVIEKLAKNKNDAVSISELFESQAVKCLRVRGLNIDIFRKPQHGGDREIYVLGFEERVVQRVIEQVARILCGFIPEETMTHPQNKTSIPENAFKEARSIYRNNHITLNSSADASKWSQNNCSFKLLIPLLKLTPRYMHRTLIRCLRLWESKRILINPFILELFDKHRDLKFYDKTVQNMFDGYKGRASFRWIKPGEPFIELTTGMMQGILHYSSSLYHSAIISRAKEVIESNNKTLVKTFGFKRPFKIVMCHLQSSDDSFFSVSCPLNGTAEVARRSRLLAASILSFKVNLSTQMGVVNSEVKSALATNHVFEFNSNFEFGFNHYKPDIKAVYSGFLVSEQELILSRQEELSVLLTTYIENGGVNYVANGLQVGQSYLHYQLIGMTTTKYFRSFQVLNTILPDPSLGFFLMDNSLCPGLLGFNYNMWNLVKTSNLGKLFKHRLRPIETENESLDETIKLSIELSAHGSLSSTHKIVHGNRAKWLKLLERIGARENWREDIEKNPSLMFRRALTPLEVDTKISQKLHSPGVSASLSSLNTLPRILAESAYILKIRSITSISSWLDPMSKHFDKVTLLEALLKEMKEILNDGHITENELKILFPFHNDFMKNQGLLETLSVKAIASSFREYKRKETRVEIATNNEYNLVNLRGLLLSYWFENEEEVNSVRLSRESRDYIFEQHKKIIPWINKDMKEALRSSPFENLVEMFTWLNTFSGRKRVIRLLGTQIISRHGHSRLLSVVMNNLSSNFRLVTDKNEVELPISSVKLVREKFSLLAALPEDEPQKADSIIRLFSQAGDRVSFNTETIRSRQNDVIIMSRLAKVVTEKSWRSGPREPVLQIISDMIKNKHGTLGIFTTRQKLTIGPDGPQYHGPGRWDGIIDGFTVGFSIDNAIGEPTRVVSITTKTRLAAVESISIRSFIKAMGWLIPSEASYRQKNKLLLNENGINTSSGIPIIVNELYEFSLLSLFKLDLTLKWTGRNLRCIATQDRSSYTVMSVAPKAQHADYSNHSLGFLSELKFDKFTTEWVRNKSLSIAEASKLINNFYSLPDEKQLLVRTNLKAKFENQGVKKLTGTAVLSLAYVSQQEVDFDVDQFILELESMDAGDFITEDFKADLASPPEIVEEEDFDFHNIEGLTEILYETTNEEYGIDLLKREAWRMHHLMDNFVKFIIESVGRDAINKLIESRVFSEVLTNYQRVFEILLNESKSEWKELKLKTLDELQIEEDDDDVE
ncbi:RNA-dependent RNA polymerase [Parry's Creek phasivirus 1]|uniref:RNA-directed RNA polymerase L n=1 Tax=Parry's Creek phasivirus 1 TaxID=2755152 RepID=A0A7D5Y022_9VIRU|nr:RNA-dependent RNA polymerase [Parry's Creek phasivirus 1]QLJ83473.1 RNA-dependent RNA polymerase [Parry's Creek phasivirus 1]